MKVRELLTRLAAADPDADVEIVTRHFDRWDETVHHDAENLSVITVHPDCVVMHSNDYADSRFARHYVGID